MMSPQEQKDEMWKPKIEDWGRIDDKAYELMLGLAKERFAETISTSEDITNKSQKLFIGLLTFITAFFSTSLAVKAPSAGTIVVAIILFLIDVCLILSLLLKKEVNTKGSAPSEAFPDNLDDIKKFQYLEQVKYVYVRQLVLHEEKIKQMSKRNNDRIQTFQIAMIYSGALFAATITYIIYLLYRS